MNAMPKTTPVRELRLTRLLDAPRDVVWAAWTDVKQLAEWWGPAGFTNPVCEIDPRPGGAIRIEMRHPQAGSHPMGGEFCELVPPERLVFLATAMADASGKPALVNRNTVVFEAVGERTRLHLHVEVLVAAPEAAPALAGMEMGWTQSLEKLAAFVAPH